MHKQNFYMPFMTHNKNRHNMTCGIIESLVGVLANVIKTQKRPKKTENKKLEAPTMTLTDNKQK